MAPPPERVRRQWPPKPLSRSPCSRRSRYVATRGRTYASTIVVQVVYKTPLGLIYLPLGLVALSSQWQPTLPMLTGSIAGGALSGGTGLLALRFTALTGSSRIDDVFIDPRMRR